MRGAPDRASSSSSTTLPLRRSRILAEAKRCRPPIRRFSPVPPPAGSVDAMGFVSCLLLPLLSPPSAAPPSSAASSRARLPTISIVDRLLFFTIPPPPPTHPRRGDPTAVDGESALDYAAFGVIVQSAGLAVVATVARASSDDAAADSGKGVSLGLFFGTRGAPAGQGFDPRPRHPSTLLLSWQRGSRVLCQDLSHRQELTGQEDSSRGGHQPCRYVVSYVFMYGV